MDPFAIPASQALVLGVLAAPLCVWAAYTDLSAMRIRNVTVLMLVAAFVVAGPFVMPVDAYLWRYVHLAVVLAIGFVLASLGAMGAGDAKFAAAMAPFVAVTDAGRVAILFAILLVVTFAAHRIARSVPAVRALAPGWQSWSQTKDFPLGITLAATLVTYLGVAAAT